MVNSKEWDWEEGICKLQSIITCCETVKRGNSFDTVVQQIKYNPY